MIEVITGITSVVIASLMGSIFVEMIDRKSNSMCGIRRDQHS